MQIQREQQFVIDRESDEIWERIPLRAKERCIQRYAEFILAIIDQSKIEEEQ